MVAIHYSANDRRDDLATFYHSQEGLDNWELG